MKSFIINRLVMLVPVLAGISLITFTLLQLVPGDPAEVYLRLSRMPPTDEAIAMIRAEMGLDRPLYVQYLDWLWNVLHLDFGKSFVTGKPVWEEIARCFPATIQLTVASMLLVLLISLPTGILAALYKDSFFDHACRILAFVGASVPGFWLGFMLMYCFSLRLDLLPALGKGTPAHLVLPSITLSLSYAAAFNRFLRTGMLENLNKHHVLYARARGLKEGLVVFRHVFRNALPPLLTALGMSLGYMLAGAVIVENVFAWPGLGRLCVSAIFGRDYPAIQCYVLIMATVFVVCNLLTDIAVSILDPRVRMGGDGDV
jgi:peptide/nickel transport system permease protein/nickel transport system permease protein